MASIGSSSLSWSCLLSIVSCNSCLIILVVTLTHGVAAQEWQGDPQQFDVCLDINSSSIICPGLTWINVTIADPDSCQEYFVCMYGLLYKFNCQAPKLFYDYIFNGCSTNANHCKPTCQNSYYENYVATNQQTTTMSSIVGAITSTVAATSEAATAAVTTTVAVAPTAAAITMAAAATTAAATTTTAAATTTAATTTTAVATTTSSLTAAAPKNTVVPVITAASANTTLTTSSATTTVAANTTAVATTSLLAAATLSVATLFNTTASILLPATTVVIVNSTTAKSTITTSSSKTSTTTNTATASTTTISTTPTKAGANAASTAAPVVYQTNSTQVKLTTANLSTAATALPSTTTTATTAPATTTIAATAASAASVVTVAAAPAAPVTTTAAAAGPITTTASSAAPVVTTVVAPGAPVATTAAAVPVRTTTPTAGPTTAATVAAPVMTTAGPAAPLVTTASTVVSVPTTTGAAASTSTTIKQMTTALASIVPTSQPPITEVRLSPTATTSSPTSSSPSTAVRVQENVSTGITTVAAGGGGGSGGGLGGGGGGGGEVTTASTTTTPAGTPAAPFVTISLTPAPPIIEGQQIVLLCTAYLSSSMYSVNRFQWSLNNQPLMSGVHGRISISFTGPTTSTLTIQPVQTTDSGTIQCYGMLNSGRFVTLPNTTIVDVKPHPQIVLNPLTLTAFVRTQITVRCTSLPLSSDIGILSFSWFKNGTLVQSTGNTINITMMNNTSMLTTIATDNAQFSCMATSNISGNSSLQNCNVSVLTATDTFCNVSVDTTMNFPWPITKSGVVSSLPCPPLQNGVATRLCNNSMWMIPNYDNCVSVQVTQILANIGELSSGIGLGNPAYVASIAMSLQNFTSSPSLTFGNLNASLSAITLLANAAVLRFNSSSSNVSQQEIKSVISCISNVLEPSNSGSWSGVQSVNPNISAQLLSSSDAYAQALRQNIQTGALGSNVSIVGDNIVLQASLVSPNELQLQSTFTYPLSDPSDGFSWQTDDSIVLPSQTLLDAVQLPSGQDFTISSTYYKNLNNRITLPESNQFIGSRILSLTVDQLVGVTNLSPKINISLYYNQTNYTQACVFWNPSSNQWDSAGCTVVVSNGSYALCQCNHLTNFAMLMSLTPVDNIIFSIISIVGCSISIGALVLTIITYALLWKHVRSHHAAVLINLCIALIVANAVFIGGANQTQIPVLCKVIAVLLHYFFLAAFFLMLAEGIEMLMYIVFVFHVRRKFETALLIIAAWLVPMVIVGVSLGVTQTQGYGSSTECWLSVQIGLVWAFVGPALFVVLANIIILIIVLVRICQSKLHTDKNKKKNRIRRTVWNIIVITPILGITWVFGVLSLFESEIIAFQYIFAIANSLQGLFIFIFHVLFNSQKMKRKGGVSSSLCFGRAASKSASKSSSSGASKRSVKDNSAALTAGVPQNGLKRPAGGLVPTMVNHYTELDSAARAGAPGLGRSRDVGDVHHRRHRLSSHSSDNPTSTTFIRQQSSSSSSGSSTTNGTAGGHGDGYSVYNGVFSGGVYGVSAGFGSGVGGGFGAGSGVVATSNFGGYSGFGARVSNDSSNYDDPPIGFSEGGATVVYMNGKLPRTSFRSEPVIMTKPIVTQPIGQIEFTRF